MKEYIAKDSKPNVTLVALLYATVIGYQKEVACMYAAIYKNCMK